MICIFKCYRAANIFIYHVTLQKHPFVQNSTSLLSWFIASASSFEVENLSFLIQNMHAYLYWMI
jgi:hypothetical protein